MKQEILDQYHHFTPMHACARILKQQQLRIVCSDFKHKFALHIYNPRCTCSANFVKIHLAVFEIPCTKDFFTKNLKNLYQMKNFKLKKNLETFSNIVFAYIAHAKFQRAIALIAAEI